MSFTEAETYVATPRLLCIVTFIERLAENHLMANLPGGSNMSFIIPAAEENACYIILVIFG